MANNQQNTGKPRGSRDVTDERKRRDPAQSHDTKGESQNVNDDAGRTLDPQESERARNKANEGLKQGRNNS